MRGLLRGPLPNWDDLLVDRDEPEKRIAEWTTSSVSFRAEMHSTLAVLRPHAVNIAYGLDYDLYAS
jgi:hypothetical protein